MLLHPLGGTSGLHVRRNREIKERKSWQRRRNRKSRATRSCSWPNLLEKEKGIPMQYLIEKIEAAISIAIKRDENGAEDDVRGDQPRDRTLL